MRLSPELAWVRPFVRCAGRYVPVDRVVRVDAYRVPLHLVERQQACCLRHGNNRAFTVRLLVEKHKLRRIQNMRGCFQAKTYYRLSKLEILELLAHELAHVVYWQHTVDHAQLACKLWGVFLRRVRRGGK